MANKRHTEPGQRDKELAVSLTAVIAAGLTSVTAATVTSRFGAAETLIGGAIAAMVSAAGPVVFKSYLDQLENATSGTRIFQSVVRAWAALKWFASLPSEGRRPILFGGLLAGVVALFLGVGTVTAAELGVGKSLPCWIWGNCPHDAPLEGTLPSVLGGGPSEGGPLIIGDDPGDAESTTTVEVEDVEQPADAAEPEKYVWQPVVTGDAEKDVEPSATAGDEDKRKGGEKPKPCGGNETTGGDAEKDDAPPSQMAVDGKSKGTKPCDGKKGGATNPEPPESGKEQRGGTTQGGDDCAGIHDPCRGKSTAQKENPPVQKEAPLLEQPRRGADEQDHGPHLEVTGLPKGGV